jgi:hypothetical protein
MNSQLRAKQQFWIASNKPADHCPFLSAGEAVNITIVLDFADQFRFLAEIWHRARPQAVLHCLIKRPTASDHCIHLLSFSFTGRTESRTAEAPHPTDGFDRRTAVLQTELGWSGIQF